jgi:hypothetical protein
MPFLCRECAPEDTDNYRLSTEILGICENDNCHQTNFPVEQTPVTNYTLRGED